MKDSFTELLYNEIRSLKLHKWKIYGPIFSVISFIYLLINLLFGRSKHLFVFIMIFSVLFMSKFGIVFSFVVSVLSTELICFNKNTYFFMKSSLNEGASEKCTSEYLTNLDLRKLQEIAKINNVQFEDNSTKQELIEKIIANNSLCEVTEFNVAMNNLIKLCGNLSSDTIIQLLDNNISDTNIESIIVKINENKSSFELPNDSNLISLSRMELLILSYQLDKLIEKNQFLFSDYINKTENNILRYNMSKSALIKLLQSKYMIYKDKSNEPIYEETLPNLLPKIDIKGTMDNLVRGLNAEDFRSMSKDAKDFMETQKMLLKTVQDYIPLVKEGQQLLDTFKGVFGSENKSKKILDERNLSILGSK